MSPPGGGPEARRFGGAAWWLGAALIIAAGEWLRFRLPPWPFADPDSWGYLGPSVTHAATGRFAQTYGRDFLYPEFLRLILHWSRDLFAITRVQHGLAALAGVLFCLCWRELSRLMPPGRIAQGVQGMLGLIGLAFLMGCYSDILYEHLIQPESLLPVSQLLAVWLTLRALRGRAGERGFGAGWAAAVVANLLVSAVHPTQMIAALAMIVLLLLHLWSEGAGRSRRILLSGFAFVAMAGALEGNRLAFDSLDDAGIYAGPMRMFAYHADIVAPEVEADARRSDPPYPAAFLGQIGGLLEDEFARTRREGSAFPHLPFNPDRLMFTDYSIGATVQRHFGSNARMMADFFSHYFRQGLMHHPGRYAAEVTQNLWMIYGPRASVFRGVPPQIDVAGGYASTVASFIRPYPQLAAYPPAAEFRRRLLASSSWPPSPTLTLMLAGFRWLSLAFFLAFYVAAALAVRAAWRNVLRPKGDSPSLRWWPLVLPCYLLGVSLCVSVSVSFDIGRYVEHHNAIFLLLIFSVPAGLTAALRPRLERSAD